MGVAIAATVTQISDRYSDETVLVAGADNIDANNSLAITVSQLAGFGDCLIMEMQLWESPITGLPSTTNIVDWRGAAGYVIDVNAVVVDILGVGKTMLADTDAGAINAVARLAPDQPVMWRQVERLFIDWAANETDAGDAADLRVFIRVKRLRNTGSPS